MTHDALPTGGPRTEQRTLCEDGSGCPMTHRRQDGVRGGAAYEGGGFIDFGFEKRKSPRQFPRNDDRNYDRHIKAQPALVPLKHAEPFHTQAGLM